MCMYDTVYSIEATAKGVASGFEGKSSKMCLCRVYDMIEATVKGVAVALKVRARKRACTMYTTEATFFWRLLSVFVMDMYEKKCPYFTQSYHMSCSRGKLLPFVQRLLVVGDDDDDG